MATNFPTSLDDFTNPTPGDSLSSPSHSGQHADINDAVEALEAKVGANGSAVTSSIDYQLNNVVVTKTGTQELSNKSLSAPTIAGGTITEFNGSPALLASIKEPVTIYNYAPSNWVDLLYAPTSNAAIQYYTTNATQNFHCAIYSSPNFNTRLNTGESITVALIIKNGATAYYPTSFDLDFGSPTATFVWQGGAAPTAGNANSHDLYVFNIVKTGTATFTVFASQTQFA